MSPTLRNILFLILTALVCACSTTRRIPDDEELYTGIKGLDINSDSIAFPEEVTEVLHEAIDARTNKKMLYLLPVGLWVYNNWSDSLTGIRGKLYNKLVEDPVLVSDVRPGLRVKMLDEILDNNGYFSGSASYTPVPSPKNSKRVSILYTINPGHVYPIDSLILLPDTTALYHTIDSLASRDIYLSRVPGVRFSMDSLNVARIRIARSLRNRGYYFFSPDYIEYLADTIMRPGRVVIKLDLASNAPDLIKEKYKVGDINIYTYRDNGRGYYDTIPIHGPQTMGSRHRKIPGLEATLIQQKPSRLRQSVLYNNITLRTGQTFSERQVNNTQSYLARLGIFSAINIDVVPDTAAATPTLGVNIGATFDKPLEASFELNASSKSNSYIGPAMTFGVTNHNIFGGGEQLSLTLTGSYEWQTGRGHSSIFNSYEVGLTGSLSFPRMLAPSFIPRRHRQLNWTRISLNGDLLNRPHFFKLWQYNMSLSYDWQSSRYISNSFTPFKLTYTKLLNTTAVFDSMMVANPAVALSFQSRFIPQVNYSFTYDRQMDRRNRINVQFGLTEAGNIFWGVYELCGVKGEKRLFGTPFSQFVKGEAQVVYGRRIGHYNWLVSRIAIGAAHAYGNASQVPYSEQFYCGGANSVRAFTVRSIGPGSYHDPRNGANDYFDQTGTFKFEANTELRFPIFGPLNGAVFLDAGNVWLLRPDALRPGGLITAHDFWRDLALGTGVGLRFDIGLLVLRGDLGIGIHAPYDTGKTGYYNMTSFGRSLAFHLAIGYPF